MDKQKQIYSYEDVSKIVNVSKACIHNMIKRGTFKKPDIILSKRMMFYSRDYLKVLLMESFKFDLDKYEENKNES